MVDSLSLFAQRNRFEEQYDEFWSRLPSVLGIMSRVSTDICIMVGKSRGQPSNLSVTASRLQVFILMAILLLLSVYVFGVSVYFYS